MDQRVPAGSGSVWSRNVDDRESIWKLFRAFFERGDPLGLRFESVDTAYSAQIREVDHRRVTLGTIQPRSGELLLETGRRFSVSGRSEGGYVFAADLVADAAGSDAAGNLFRFELPKRLLLQQRRRGPRFELPASLRNGRAKILLVQGPRTASGAIEDISASGCRAQFDAVDAELLNGRDVFDRALIDVAGLLSIGARVAIRYRAKDAKAGRVTCGMEFTRMDPDDAERLEQFVRNLANRASRS